MSTKYTTFDYCVRNFWVCPVPIIDLICYINVTYEINNQYTTLHSHTCIVSHIAKLCLVQYDKIKARQFLYTTIFVLCIDTYFNFGLVIAL